MKKGISTALMTVTTMLTTSLIANDIALDTNKTIQSHEVTLESIMAMPDDPNAKITPPSAEHVVAEEGGERSLGMKIAGAVIAPVYVAGMVVTAIVVAPVWLVKKALGE